MAQPWNVGLWGRRLPVPTPTQKIPFTSSPQGWSWPSSILMPSAGPQATPSHFFLIPPLLAWWKERQSPAWKPLPAPAPSSQLGLFLQGFWCPQGHTALSGNYSSGQLSLAFLSSESCVFLPLFGGGSVAGQPSRASLQGEAQPSSPALLTGAGLSSCP